MKYNYLFTFLCFLLITHSQNLQADLKSTVAESIREKTKHQLPYIDEAPNIDASLNEAVWQKALKIELNYETSPRENLKPLVKTEVLLFENGTTLYVAFKAFDSKPEEIKDYLTDRDNIWDSDFVGIKLDTFGESRKVFQFFVNALGVQADAIQEDFKGDNSNWDAIWNSSGKITKNGYIVEIAIPFKALRFPESNVEQNWGVELLRFYPRKHRHRIANTPVNRDIPCKICQFDSLVGLKNAKPSQNLSLIPTLVTGQTDTRDAFNSPWNKGDIDNEASLDLRWGITQDIYLNATINPDFSQVEADSPQLNINNPFSIFVEEKRAFFLDGGDYFETDNQLVNTRNIIAPNYGAKVTGQTNGHSFGIMTVDDDHTNIILPQALSSRSVRLNNESSENKIIRYSYDLGNKNNIGIIHTNRSANDYSNQVTAIDGKYWLNQYYSLAVQYMSAKTSNSPFLVDRYHVEKNTTGDAVTINFRHDSRNWWGYANFNEYDKDFRADLGFISQVDFDKTILGLGHRWFFPEESSWWHEISLGGDWNQTFDNSGTKLEEETELNLSVFGKLQSEIHAGLGQRNRLWNQQYFNESYYYLDFFSQPLKGVKLSLELNWGKKIDFTNTQLGDEFIVTPEINWQINRNWFAKFEYEHVDFDVPDGNLFVARLSNFRLIYQMSIQSFLRLTVQKTDISRIQENYINDIDATTKSINTQLLYTYKINPQTLFFAGYADEGYQDDEIQKIEKKGRSVFMKFSYAWQL